MVSAKAVVERSALWEGTTVGPDARVSGSIVAFDAAIGANATVTEAVLANGAEVSEGQTLEPGARIMPGERT